MLTVQTREDMNYAVRSLANSEIIAWDTETFWTEDWDRRKIIGVSVYNGTDGFYIPVRHDHSASLFGTETNVQFEWLRELPWNSDAVHLWFNAKGDLQVLWKDAIYPSEKYIDLMLWAHTLDENAQRYSLKGSDSVSSRWLGLQDSDLEQKKLDIIGENLGGWEKIPPSVMGVYAIKDVVLTYDLYKTMLPEMEKQKLTSVWEKYDNPFSNTMARLEYRGTRVDIPRITETHEGATERIEQLERELGFDPAKPARLAEYLFINLGFSPIGFTAHRSKQFPQGRPIMDEWALNHYKHPSIPLILEHRGLVKARSTYLGAYLERSDSEGNLHPYFKLHGTKTFRLSCEKPNLQQIPRDETTSPIPVKKMFLARPGYVLYEFDYSQIELRLATVYSQDSSLLEEYRKEDPDVHQLTADYCGIPRQGGKTLNFCMVYGGGVDKVAELLDVGPDEASYILNRFHRSYPLLKLTAERVQRAAMTRNYVKYWTGRRKHFKWASEHHKAFNALIQGGCLEIIKHSMNLIDQTMPDIHQVCFVHDSNWIEIPQENTESYISEIQSTMSDWCLERFKIPFPVEYKVLHDPRTHNSTEGHTVAA